MKIKDIVNRDIVNLSNCDQEPIHIPGSIQPNGFLLAVNRKSGLIEYASENCSNFLNISYQKILGQSFEELFAIDIIKQSEEYPAGKIGFTELSFAGNEFEAMLHRNNGHLIVEIEKVSFQEENPDLLELSKEFVEYIENTSTLIELCEKVSVGIRKITGYDRVMVYRFDEMYNGEVIAEARSENIEAFLGLHYPHTDIPSQARELYIRNQIRLIVDVDYKPVPIYTIDDGSEKQLDLSYSLLRSVSPIHCQYLRNMGVGATLTISLLHRGKLWGLVACHHYSPRYLNYQVRMATKLMGHLITSHIETRKINEEHQIYLKTKEATDKIFSQKHPSYLKTVENMFSDQSILDICNANGAALISQGQVFKFGEVPSDNELKKLAEQLLDYGSNRHVNTDSLIKIIPQAAEIAHKFPGVLYYPFSIRGNCMMWFRKETVHEVHWGADPTKAIEKDKNGLTPRKSFELWKEVVKDTSKPWLDAELSSAGNFINILYRHLTMIFIGEEAEKQKQLAYALKSTNEELQNINWISTHDLQEPLRKIQMIASFILQDEKTNLNADTTQMISRMSSFASKMQTLIKDLLRYNHIDQQGIKMENLSLNDLLKNAEAETDQLIESRAVLTINRLPVLNIAGTLVQQVFNNLLSNSLKYAQPGRSIEINIDEVRSSEAPYIEDAHNYHIIRYRDNGHGFPQDQHENIFKIFSRLSAEGNYTGSGIGLALSRKIMAMHKGFIKAKGKPGVGAEFFLYFPKADPVPVA